MKDRIKQVRKALHLNQTEFGLLVGVKGNTIANYEIGLRTPSEAVLFSICREFNVNNDWLRTGEEPFPFAQTVELMKLVIAGLRSRNEGGREVFLSEIDV